MHRSSATYTVGHVPDHSVDWSKVMMYADLWIQGQPVDKWKQEFDQQGYLVVQNLLYPEEIATYQQLYDQMLSGEINTTRHRHDLGNHVSLKTNEENICQIMWPSLYVSQLSQGPLHCRSFEIAKVLLGPDTAFDFDMLIYKAPNTATETPWHQDESYWPDLPDKRAVSCWVALDPATVDNGCMWFVPGSYAQGLRSHRPAKEGHHALQCTEAVEGGVPVPLSPGSCTLHHGRTLHHTEGNSTASRRRAYIVNYRPEEMVKQERQQGFDHGQRGLEVIQGVGQGHSRST